MVLLLLQLHMYLYVSLEFYFVMFVIKDNFRLIFIFRGKNKIISYKLNGSYR